MHEFFGRQWKESKIFYGIKADHHKIYFCYTTIDLKMIDIYFLFQYFPIFSLCDNLFIILFFHIFIFIYTQQRMSVCVYSVVLKSGRCLRVSNLQKVGALIENTDNKITQIFYSIFEWYSFVCVSTELATTTKIKTTNNVFSNMNIVGEFFFLTEKHHVIIIHTEPRLSIWILCFPFSSNMQMWFFFVETQWQEIGSRTHFSACLCLVSFFSSFSIQKKSCFSHTLAQTLVIG